ncbi:MAG: lysine--tRNA ligase, partial [Pseudomonadota bacterium]|nr:lysine--tRNA ligase [Pseudomonadota bacterium]
MSQGEITIEDQAVELDENEQIAQRREKLGELHKRGIAYPNTFRREHLAGDLHAQYATRDAEKLAVEKVHVKVAGRIMTRRIM